MFAITNAGCVTTLAPKVTLYDRFRKKRMKAIKWRRANGTAASPHNGL